MEDQGKRLLTALAIVAAMSVAYMYLFPPKKPAPKEKEVAGEEAAAGDAGAGSKAPGGSPGQPEATKQEPGTVAPAGPDAAKPAAPVLCDPGTAHKEQLEGADFTMEVSACGGAVKSWVLRDLQWGVRKDGQTEPLDMVRTGGNPAWFPYQVSVGDSVPVGGIWEVKKVDEHRIRATLSAGGLAVEKIYSLGNDRFTVELTTTITNVGRAAADVRLELYDFGRQDPKAPTRGMFSYAPPHWGVSCNLGKNRYWSVGHLRNRDKERVTGEVRYGGITHKYFMFVAAPIEPREEDMSCGGRALQDTDPDGIMEVKIGWPTVRLAAGASEQRAVLLFGGPKLLDALQAVNSYEPASGGEQTQTGMEKAMNVALAFLAVPMLKLLKVYHGWVFSWPVAIVLLTLTVKLATLYWTHKSMRSMKAMGRLKPKMDELREKYGDDRQRMNVELMNLYKTHKINPLSGCLPMLLQMPVWIALYEALGAAADLYQVRFLWMPDLTAPDPLYILPVLMTGTMFLQQKLSPTTMDSAQQKMMMYMMPLMFGAFSLVFPAGLTVYIFTNTLLGMAHQIYMNKTEPAAPTPAVPAAAATSSTPAHRGPLPRGRNKKG